MDKMWLVQSGKFRENPKEKLCINDFISFSYMGAAEYEFESIRINGKYETKNPLFLSLRRIIFNKNKFEWIKMSKVKDANNDNLYIFCKTEDIIDARENVKKLLKGAETKRPCGLSGYYNMTKERMNERKNSSTYINFWWDIENDIFIVFGEDKITIINEILTIYYNKWKHELSSNNKLINTIKSVLNKIRRK